MSGRGPVSHAAHWGSFSAVVAPGGRIDVRPSAADPAPSSILRNLEDAQSHRSRVARPAIRLGWLERGPGADPARGSDAYVEVDWPTAWRLAGSELARVYGLGAEHVYGGSYGWASAGRFHHAQSQIHRFLNLLGGYVRSENSYSAGAAEVILPHVLASKDDVGRYGVRWRDVVEHAELVVSFGGMPLKNAQIDAGGTSRHEIPGRLAAARERGARLVVFSPVRDDLPADSGGEWHAIRPGTDVAVMLAIAHVLIAEGLVRRQVVDAIAVGRERFEAYVLGETGGVARTPEWAADISGVPPSVIRDLARVMASRATLVTVSQSIQRAEFGEQPVWMALALATLLGEIGLPGRGFSFGLGTMAHMGNPRVAVPLPTLPQGENRVAAFIPVARIADMLLGPGTPFAYDGRVMTYPDIRLVYWAGGNPFHHHQDLGRLASAFARPDTVIVHEAYWTATARHADIVLPATITLEREDIAGAGSDAHLVAMRRVCDPYGEARDDYDILAGLADELGVEAAFTEGRTAEEWLRFLYESTRAAAADAGCTLPDFDGFRERGEVALPLDERPTRVEAFRADPLAAPLPTPSGRVELFSATIAGFDDPDEPGHPVWREPVEWQGGALAARYPLLLIANQPARRLHSQLDFGAFSAEGKRDGREIVRIHPADAAPRGIEDGDAVRIHNARGACLATAAITDAVMPGVLQLSTGAWYAPASIDGRRTCVHGNPNAVTADRGTSRLAQGSTGQHSLVEVERFTGVVPAIDPYAPPPLLAGRA